jgi:hypothetical protein
VSVITAIASPCLVNSDALADINPMFENDTNIVPMPPEQSAFSNGEKVVERDVEAYREKAQSICMHLGVCSGDVVSNNTQFPAMVAEQQPVYTIVSHRSSNLYVARAGFGTEERRDAAPTISLCNRLRNLEPDSKLNGQCLVKRFVSATASPIDSSRGDRR